MKTTARHGCEVEIEDLPGGGVVVSAVYPPQRRRNLIKGLFILAAVFLPIPVILWLAISDHLMRLFWTFGSLLFIVPFLALAARQALAFSTSFVLRADSEGLTIARSNGKKTSEKHFARSAVKDVILNFDNSKDRTFKAWLVIKTTDSLRSIKCFHNFEGDLLARIANALRAALGMPARSWP